MGLLIRKLEAVSSIAATFNEMLVKSSISPLNKGSIPTDPAKNYAPHRCTSSKTPGI